MNELACAGVIFIVFLIMGMMALLTSLNKQLGVKPTPTSHDGQHIGFGCAMVLLLLVGLTIAALSMGKL